MAIQCLIFDYDGVIVDSFHDMHVVYQILCKELGYDCPTDPEEFRGMYGRSYKTLYVALGIPEQLWEKGSAIYYREIIKRNPQPFSLIKGQLEILVEKYTLYVVSATYLEEVQAKLKQHHLSGYFKGVYGRGSVTQRSNKANAIKQILKIEGIHPDQAIHIGDRNVDYEQSVEAGLKHTIILDYGWGNTITNDQTIKVKRQEDLIGAIQQCD